MEKDISTSSLAAVSGTKLRKLRKNAFKIGEAHSSGEIARSSIGQYLALCSDDDAIAYLLDDL